MFTFIRNIFSPQTVYNGVKLGGYRPDPPDQRDIPFSTFVGIIGTVQDLDHVDFRSKCSTVEDQSSSSSCVANAVVGGLELLENTQGSSFIDLSRLFLYYNARAALGETAQDSGTYIRLAMQCLTAQGVCPESMWPFDLSRLTVRPTWKSYREAYGHKIRAFYRITGTGDARVEQIEMSLISGNPVVFGVDVYKNFVDLRSINAPGPEGKSVGRHAMLIVGFDRAGRYFIIRNSWGSWWGSGGYCFVPYSWLDACNCQDVWSMTKCGV